MSIIAEIKENFYGINRCKARLLRCLGEIDDVDIAVEHGCSSLATWLVRELGISRSSAYEYVSMARRSQPFAYMLSALEAGDIDYSVIRLLLKYIRPDNEIELVELAKQLGHKQLKIALSGRETNAEEEDKEYFLRLTDEDDGSVVVKARLNPADGAMFKAALKIGESAYHGESTEDTDTKPQRVSGYGMPIGRALLSSLMGIVHLARTRIKAPLRTPGAQVNLVLNHEGHLYMPSNPKAPSKALRRMLDNAVIRLDTVNDRGETLSLGRGQRLASDKQVNVLLRQWHHQCAMPGCTHTRFIEIHHIEAWADGGETNVENLIPLCSACHSLVSEGYAHIERQGDDIGFFYPDGTAYISTGHGITVRDDSLVRAPEPLDAWSFDDSELGEVSV